MSGVISVLLLDPGTKRHQDSFSDLAAGDSQTALPRLQSRDSDHSGNPFCGAIV